MSEDQGLQGCSVLVIEDHYLIAEDLRKALEGAGAIVLGPYADAAAAVAIADREKPGCALVDINLGPEANFAPAKALLARGVPIAFVTGYGLEAIPPDLSKVPHVQKPATREDIVRVVRELCAQRA